MKQGPVRRPITTKSQKDRVQDKQIKHLQRQLSGLKPEPKYIDYFTTTAPTGGYIAMNYTLIAQGDDFNNRIGEEIKAQRLDINISLSRGAATSAGTMRTLVLWDKQWNGASVFNPLTSLSLTEGLIDDLTITNTAQSPLNARCAQRYKILMDKFHVWAPSEPTCSQRKVYKKSINLSNAIIKYGDSGATAASLVSRALLVVHFNMDAGSVTCTHNTTARLHYTDQ